MSSAIIITGADSHFFDLVKGTILSIRYKPQGQLIDIGFFNLGCSLEEINWVLENVNYVVEPDWEYTFPGIENAPLYLRGLLARPHLPKYFPGYEVYIWLDADAWVQEWFGIDLLIQGSKKRGLAIVPEIDRGNRLLYGSKEHLIELSKAYRHYFPNLNVDDLHTYPLLNAGVFALLYSAPHWNFWDLRLAQALAKRPSVLTDQLALNVAVYLDGLLEETELLPAYCNWTCHYGLPRWDPKRSLFVEPYLPYTPISILHLTSSSKKQASHTLLTTEDERIDLSLRFQQSKACLRCNSGQTSPLEEHLDTATSEIYLSQLNLVLFPNWDPSFQEATISSLELLLEFILLSPSPQDYALIVSAEPDYGMADSVLATAATNVALKLIESGYELKGEPSISLVKALNSEQWKRLLAQVNYHYPLAHEQIPAGIQPVLDGLPRFELPSR
ncbi:hypothetical protein NW852_10225 [Synechococcus sp. H60.1]